MRLSPDIQGKDIVTKLPFGPLSAFCAPYLYFVFSGKWYLFTSCVQFLASYISVFVFCILYLQGMDIFSTICPLMHRPQNFPPLVGAPTFSVAKSRSFNLMRLKLNNLGGIKGLVADLDGVVLQCNGYGKRSESDILFCNHLTLKQGARHSWGINAILFSTTNDRKSWNPEEETISRSWRLRYGRQGRHGRQWR